MGPEPTPVKRLRWKNHREIPVRGDEVTGIQQPENGERIRFLKVEAKSKAAFNARTAAPPNAP